MAEILEKFDFDDRPGLEKLKNIVDGAQQVSNAAQKMGDDVQAAVDNSMKKTGDLDKSFGKIGKTIGTVGKAAVGIAGAATLAFGAATAAAIKLGSQNERIAQQQEEIGKKFGKVQEVLAEKLAPIIYVIQQSVGTLLDKVLKTGGDIQNSVIVKIAAGIKGIQAAVGQAFKNLGANIKISVNDFKILGKNIQAIFSRGDKKDSIRGEIEALRKENAELAKETRYIGDAYKEAYDQAKKSITDLVENGYFKLKKVDKEALERINQLRQAYAKFNDELNKRLIQSRIANSEGLERLKLEKEEIDKVIDALEKEGKALADKLGIEFEGEKTIIELRRNAEISYQKERKELIEKTNEEIAKESREIFKNAFGIYFEDLEELGKKASNEFADDFEDAIQRSVKNATDFSKNAVPTGSDKGIFDDFKKKLFDSLGVTQEEGDFILGITGDILQQTQELFTANIDRRIADNERLLDSIRERRNVLQNELDEELKLQAIGRENNVKSKQEELAKLAAQEQKAQKEREQLEKKQRRAQFAADLVQQVSSLTTAAANVFKANSNIPIVGVILGIAAVAALFAAFNAAKNKAASAAKGTNPLYRGGSLKGKLQNKSGFVNWLHGRPDKPGHGQGHRIEDSNIILGGREMIVAEEPANHQSDNFWDNMNSGRYNSLDLESTLDDHMTNPKTINTNFEKRQVKIVKIREANKQKGGYINEDQLNKALAKQARTLINYFESKPEYVAFSEDQKIARIRKSSKEVNVSDSKEIFKAS